MPHSSRRILLIAGLALVGGFAIGALWSTRGRPDSGTFLGPDDNRVTAQQLSQVARQIFELQRLLPVDRNGSVAVESEHGKDAGVANLKARGWLEAMQRALGIRTTIAGGTPVSSTSLTLPFFAAIVDAGSGSMRTRFHCGATFVASDWLITAAHCVEAGTSGKPVPKERFQILSGTVTLSGSGTTHDIEHIYLHPSYNVGGYYDNDVALIQLATASSVSPIALAEASTETAWRTAGTAGIVAGWGDVPSSTAPDEYLVADLAPVDKSDCVAEYLKLRPTYRITDAMICAGKAGTSICHGDSGGPLVVTDAGVQHLMGVGSFNFECAKNYSVFASIPSTHAWIDACMASADGSACLVAPPPAEQP